MTSTAQIEQDLSKFASTLCDSAQMKPGRAALISVGLTYGTGEAGGSITGHAIAAYCCGGNECYLFDPNIGNFRCTSRDNLREAIVRLITAWETKMGWTLRGEFGYSLFERRATLEAVKTPRDSGGDHAVTDGNGAAESAGDSEADRLAYSEGPHPGAAGRGGGKTGRGKRSSGGPRRDHGRNETGRSQAQHAGNRPPAVQTAGSAEDHRFDIDRIGRV